jgi:hypothetical protein
MAAVSRKSLSLTTLLLLTTISALIVGLVAVGRRLADAQAEVEDVRRKYGHIRAEDPGATYIARIEENESSSNEYRLVIPPGSHYLIHVTETTFLKSEYPVDPIPTETISLNSWKNGADVVLSYSIYVEGDDRRLIVHTNSEQFFDYQLKDWTDGTMPNEASHLQTDGQRAFQPDETIRFMWYRNPETKRGVMLWMEPANHWEARRAKANQN